MWYCNNCGAVFDEPIEKPTTYENIYGVSGEVESRTYTTICLCPNCGTDDIEEG